METQIIVFGFVDRDGEEQDFSTLDEDVARDYASANRFSILEKICQVVEIRNRKRKRAR